MKTELEESLSKIFSEVLNIPGDKIAVDDSIFDLGAHSIQLATLLARIDSDLGHRMCIEALWNHPSISQIADHIVAKST